ncbi:hypothetical protein Q2490_15120 [Myroides odoratimimus]|uniref:hypothetical protein n=1 Tax=Myroides odoratimimus TaxID=76832 RepID=UPI0026DED731|nr:hypothetical protein [Myroides odoratimimus]MDO5858615.1 hypothetical protein [Myroides odoratimimus]
MYFTNPILKERKYYSNGNIEYLAMSYNEGFMIKKFSQDLCKETGALKLKEFIIFKNQYIETSDVEEKIILNKKFRFVYDEEGFLVSRYEYDNENIDDYTPLDICSESIKMDDEAINQIEYYPNGNIKRMINRDARSEKSYLEYYNNGNLKAEVYRDLSMFYSYEEKFNFYKEFPINIRVLNQEGEEQYVLYFDVHSKYMDLHFKNTQAKKHNYLVNRSCSEEDMENDQEERDYESYQEDSHYNNKIIEDDYYETGFDIVSILCLTSNYRDNEIDEEGEERKRTYLYKFKVPKIVKS